MKKLVKNQVPIEYLGPDDRWKCLGIAIVKQAIIDWQEATLRLARPETASHEMLMQKRSAEAFLRSQTCEFYSGCDGLTLLRKMKEGGL